MPAPNLEIELDSDADLPATRSTEAEIEPILDLPARPDEFPVVARPTRLDDRPVVHSRQKGGPPPVPGRPPAPPPQPPPPPDPPFAVAEEASFGELNLPNLAHRSDLPSLPDHQNLPAVAETAADFPQFRAPVQELPELAARPQPAWAPSVSGFGEIDLPLVADDPVHPLDRAAFGDSPAHLDLPLPTHAGLPEVAGQLPVAAGSIGLPAPNAAGLPTAAQAGGLPAAATGSGLPAPAWGGGLPATASGGGLPAPAFGGGLPTAAQSLGFPARGGPFSGGAGGTPGSQPEAEVSFGEVGAELQGANPFDDSDRAVPAQNDASPPAAGGEQIDLAVGDEVELATGGSVPFREHKPQQPARPAEPARKGGGRQKLAIATFVAAVLLGGSLAFVPAVGPFGWNFISDQIGAPENARRLADLRKTTNGLLGQDTGASLTSALATCKSTLGTMRRFAPVKAYCAYVALERGLRFGRRTEDEALAKLLLDEAGDAGGDSRALATAAKALLAGQTGPASRALDPLRSSAKAGSDESIAVLAARIATASKMPDQAKVAWRAAVTAQKSARTLFGLATALYTARDIEAAREAAKAALQDSKYHAGARILLARIEFMDLGREPDALTFLKEVTETPAIRAETDNSELVEAFTLLGMIHLAKSRISMAEQAFAAALKMDPLAIQALIGNGELLYRSGRYSEAQARFEAASKVDAENVAAQVGIAKTWVALERIREAKELLKKLRETHPADPLILLWQGRCDEALGNKKEAEAAYQQGIKVGKVPADAVDAYVALAHLLSGSGRTDDANAKLAEASSKFPDSPVLHRAKGDVALQMGRYDEARKEFEAGLAREEDIATRFRLGVALRHLKRYDDAARAFEKVAASDKDFPGLALERGIIFEETGHSDQALESYRRALEKAPNDLDLKLRVGSTQVIAGHGKEAEAILQEVRKARPNSAEVNHFLGRAILLQGRAAADALRFLEMAVNLDTNRAEYFLYLGWAANELGGTNNGKARGALNRAIELDHELGDAYWQRGVLLQREGATLDALHDLETALQKRPSRFEAWATTASCQQDLQRWDEAEKAWQKAIAGNDNVAEWHYRLGKLLFNRGSHAAALPELEKATSLGDRPDQPLPVWLFDAHLLLADADRARNDRQGAIRHYQRFLETAPAGNAYVVDAQKALEALGAVKKDK